jgi:hypothetical protein
LARAKAWRGRARPNDIVLDLDATLVTSHSEKENAAPNFKRGFGFHPVLCYVDQLEEALAGKLRPGNATANNTADNIEVLELALQQLPASKHQRAILVRADSACATHSFVAKVREHELTFSIGLDLYEPVRKAILNMDERAWVPAIDQDGEAREGAAVCELANVDLRAWPAGTRASTTEVSAPDRIPVLGRVGPYGGRSALSAQMLADNVSFSANSPWRSIAAPRRARIMAAMWGAYSDPRRTAA